MRVVMLSDFESRGGAAIAASRLAEGLCAAGHQVTRLVNRPDGQEHSWATRSLAPSSYRQFIALSVVQGIIGARLYDRLAVLITSHRLERALAELRPDVINTHNVHSAVRAGWSLKLLRICCRCAPTVWTLHDMWSFTGRCAYSYDCREFITGCNAFCPTHQEYPELAPDLIADAWKQRQRLFAEHPDLVAVCPSRWLARDALAGLWKGHRVEVIPNGLPLNAYQAINQDLARAALGIESLGPVLLTMAEDWTVRRKGGGIIVEAMKSVSSRPLTLVTFGYGRLPIQADGIRVYPLGYVDHERTKVLAYSAADLFVHPAPVDNLPNTLMEAIACGTPAVGFATGGVPDMVRLGQTGWLADEVSPGALARTIERALTELGQGLNLRVSCRTVAEAKYSSNFQARRYSELFESLV